MKIAKENNPTNKDSLYDTGEPTKTKDFRIHHIVDDEYDFVGNDRSDETTIANWVKFKKLVRDVFKTREYIETLYEGWNSHSTTEKEILAKWFIVDKTLRDTLYTDIEQNSFKVKFRDSGLFGSITHPVLTSNEITLKPVGWEIATSVNISSNNKKIKVHGFEKGIDKEIKRINNVGDFDLMLVNKSSRTLDGCLISCGGKRSLKVLPNGVVSIQYFEDEGYWRVICKSW